MVAEPLATTDLNGLVRRFQKGDLEAFEALMSRFGETLARFVGHLVRDRHQAEDLLQNLWLKAWVHRESLGDPAKIKAWLYRIAHREFLMQVRKRHPVPAPEMEDSIDAASSTEPSPADLLIREEDARRVMERFDELPERLRIVLWLAVVEELPHAQIAKVLDIPEGTCRSRLHYALRQLRQVIENRRLS